MNKFKIGDRVECIEDNEFGLCKKGDIGTLIYINDDYYEILIDIINYVIVGPLVNIEKYFKLTNNFKLIFNAPATILFKDGKKYVAKCHPDDTFDEMIGLQVALLKSFGIKYDDIRRMLELAKKGECNEK